jgi:lysophospholipase L1-like esterase
MAGFTALAKEITNRKKSMKTNFRRVSLAAMALVLAFAGVVIAAGQARRSEGGGTQGTENFYIHNGDRVVFYGDSITEQRLYTNFAEAAIVTRFPEINVEFTNSGIGGDRVTGGWAGPIDTRLDRDVMPYKPTVVTIMLGMNDAGYRPYDEALFNTFTAGYRHILDRLTAALPNLRLTLIEPSPFDDVTRPPQFEGGYNGVLQRYAAFVGELGRQHDATVADFNAPMVAMLQRADASDHELAQKLLPDRVHPAPAGHWVMAEALLKAWHAPALVSEVELDAGSGKGSAKNATVTNIKTSGANGSASISWSEKEDALPLPLYPHDKATALVMQSSDLVQALDQEKLKIAGLHPGNYRLSIDGAQAGTFSAGELAAGVNLATLDTPMLKQAQEALDLTNLHNNIHRMAWIDLQFRRKEHPLAHQAADVEDMNRIERDVLERRKADAQPKTHEFEVVEEAKQGS